MNKIFYKKGFALISVFIISLLLISIIGFTYINVSRSLNLKNIIYNSKKSFTIADAGLEQMTNQIQNYYFDTLVEYLAFNDNKEPFIYKLKNDFDNTINSILDCKNISNEEKEKLYNSIPELFKEYFKSIFDGNYFPLRAKYFYNFDRIENNSLYNSLNKKIDLDTYPDLSNITLKVSDFGLDIFLENLSEQESLINCKDCIDSILNEIYYDIEESYNMWTVYVISKINELIESFGGLSNDNSSCQTLNYQKIIIPYDIDHPVIDQNKIDYEGIIVRTADIVEMKLTQSDYEPTKKIIISVICYVFNKPIPKLIFKSLIQNKLTLICPRAEDSEYKNYSLFGSSNYPQINHKIYVNALDVDITNQKIKCAGLSYEFTPIKRGIKAEFKIPFIWSDINKQIIFNVFPESKINLSSLDSYWLQFPNYLISSNNDIVLTNNEHLRGPVRSNNHIYFSGETNDVMISKRSVEYKGKFNFIYNGLIYTVDFKDWNEVETWLPVSPIPPLNSGIILHDNKIKISNDNKTIIDADGIIRYKNWFIDLNADENFNIIDSNKDGKIDDKDEYDKIFLVYSEDDIKLENANSSESLINQTRQQIYNSTYKTPYYISTGGNGYIVLDLNKDKLIYKINGFGNLKELSISSNSNTVLYVDGDIYFKGGGFLDGKLTIFSTGNIYFKDGPVRYKNAPKLENDNQFPVNKDDIDMLGIITPKKVYFSNNSNYSMIVDVNILAGEGIETDKKNPNKIQINGSLSFYETYTGEYKYELLMYDYYLLVTNPPIFPIIRPESKPLTTEIIYPYTISTKNLLGQVKEIYFSRRIWREMVNPP